MVATEFRNLDTDDTLSANSDYRIPSQKAVKTNFDKKPDKDTVYTKTESDNRFAQKIILRNWSNE